MNAYLDRVDVVLVYELVSGFLQIRPDRRGLSVYLVDEALQVAVARERAEQRRIGVKG